jgi:hypothetical protein
MPTEFPTGFVSVCFEDGIAVPVTEALLENYGLDEIVWFAERLIEMESHEEWGIEHA